MSKLKNSPEVWDNVWSEETSPEEDLYHLETHRKSIRWKRLKQEILKRFGTFKGLKTIEIGAGMGTYSLLFALEGAEVTLLDYSKKALDSSRLFFTRHNTKAKYINMDALNLDKKLFSKFDVSISVGVAEHFGGMNRLKIIDSHFKVLRPGGLAIIDVPNKWSLPYRFHKFLSESFGRWIFGKEIPYARTEFKKIGKKLNKRFYFIGGYILDTPFNFKKRIKAIIKIKDKKDISTIKQERGTFLDQYISRTLIALASK